MRKKLKAVKRYKITEDYIYQSNLKGYSFDSDWLLVEPTGKIVVKANGKGFKWDGCTPKFNILDLFIIGTPDGIINVDTGYPKTFYASMVHDVMYQYFDEIPIPKKKIDRLFYDMLKKEKFKLSFLYYIAVKLFAGLFVKQKGLLDARRRFYENKK